MMRCTALLLVASAACAPVGVPAGPQSPVPTEAGMERPLPHPVEAPATFLAAVSAGTRTETGEPGPGYWTNREEYRVRATLDPASPRVDGTVDIRYHNRSPDTLTVLVLELTQNFHAPGAVRLEEAEVTGGMEIRGVTVRGRALEEGGSGGPRYVTSATNLFVVPAEPVLPGGTVDLAVDFGFSVPRAGAGGRMGHEGGNLVFLAYWHPRMAVYDDLEGWHTEPFTGVTEFYHGFGTHEVTLEVPAGWAVFGTGRLVNADEVLAEPVLRRMRLAEQSDTTVRILGPDDFGRATRARTGTVAWSFRAENVRDNAYGITRGSIWDGARTPVGEGRYTTIHTFWRPTAPRWAQVTRYQQHAIRFLSEYTGIPYPWPHMTAVEGGGIIGGGMEFPMITLMGDYNAQGDSALYYVTAHELAHMWVPMIVSNNERRRSWIDEGKTTFKENLARMDFFPGVDHHMGDRLTYLRVNRMGVEEPMMRHSTFHASSASFLAASYAKPATVLVALRGVLGEETFQRAYLEFLRRWSYRHPTPWDFFNTMSSVSGRDLDWFWRTWYYETWVLDQAVSSVTEGPRGTVVTVTDLGTAPMPAHLTVTRADGRVVREVIPVDVWLQGARTATLTLPAGAAVTRVEIDAENAFPDIDRRNNVWPR
jgi:hypothetical protein